MKAFLIIVALLITGVAKAETVELPIDLFNDQKLIDTLRYLKGMSYSVTRIENHSLSSAQGVSIQIFHMTPIYDGYRECTFMTRVTDGAPAGHRVQLIENRCPRV